MFLFCFFLICIKVVNGGSFNAICRLIFKVFLFLLFKGEDKFRLINFISPMTRAELCYYRPSVLFFRFWFMFQPYVITFTLFFFFVQFWLNLPCDVYVFFFCFNWIKFSVWFKINSQNWLTSSKYLLLTLSLRNKSQFCICHSKWSLFAHGNT